MARQEMQQAERGLVLLRIMTGLWLLRSSVHHLAWTPWPKATAAWAQATAAQLSEHATQHPSLWVRMLAQDTLVPNAEFFASLTAFLSFVAGLALTCGLLTVPGGLLAALLALLGGGLTHYQGGLLLGYHLLLGVAGLVLALTRAGRRWGFDAVLGGVRPDSHLW